MHPGKWSISVAFIRQNKLLVAGSVIAVIASNFLSVLLPLSIGKFYEIVFHDHGTKSRLMRVLSLDFGNATTFFIFFGILVVVKALITYLSNYWIGLVGERFSRNIRELAFSHQMHHSMESHRSKPVGNYLLRYSGDLLAIQKFISKGILMFAGDLFFMVCFTTLLWMLQPNLAVTVTGLFILAVVVFVLLSRVVRMRAMDRRNYRSSTLAFVSARLHSFNTIKSFNRERPETNFFRRRSRKLYRLGVRFLRLSSLVQSVLSLYFFITISIVMFEILRWENDLPKHDIFAFVLLLLYMQTVMKRVLRINVTWQVGVVSFNKLIALLRLPIDKRDGIVPKKSAGEIEVRNLQFSYSDGQSLISNVSFVLHPGTITLIKGPTGSGKSALLKLIQRIYHPQSGEILLDGKSYDELSPFAVRKNVTIVSQETPLLGRRVLDAITYNSSATNKRRAETELKNLGLSGDNSQLRLDTKIEGGGKNLSAGENLLLQFARALVTRKKIILMDEPFVNLDRDSLNNVINRLVAVKSKRTTVIVCENPPAQLPFDQIIVLENKIIQS